MRIDIKGVIVTNDDKWIYDLFELEATSPKDVISALEKAKDETADIFINSGGGDIFAGSEIYDAIRRHEGKKKIHVVGIAGSAASVIMCACESDIAPTAMVMVHNVSSYTSGDYHSMDKESEILQKANRSIASAYAMKTGMAIEEALELMDRETWMDAREAVDKGLVDEITKGSEEQPANIRLVAAAGDGMLPRKVIDKIKQELLNSKPEKEALNKKSCALAQAKLNLLTLRRS